MKMTSIRQTPLVLAVLLALGAVNAQRYHKQVYFSDAVMQSIAEDAEQATEGEAMEEVDNMIIGGSNVMPGDLPFYGHFMGTTMCGGALIHEDLFVTAAHCLADGFPLNVRIGATTTVSENEGQLVPVCAGIIHPNNNMKSMANDIAILKLCDPVFVNAYATWNNNPAYPSATGEDMFIVGFGRTNVTGNLSAFLQKAKVDYLSSDVCTVRYNKYNPTETMCVDAPSAGICYGDSGGPLLDINNNLVGLASFIIDTCTSDYPDFFTRVSTYDEWLKEMVCTQAIQPPMYCADKATTGGDGTGTQGQDDDDDDDADADEEESPLTACLDLVLGIFEGLVGPRAQEFLGNLF